MQLSNCCRGKVLPALPPYNRGRGSMQRPNGEELAMRFEELAMVHAVV